MNNKKAQKKIILYIDNQMTKDEKIEFEDQLKKSPSLRKDLEDVRKKYKLLRSVSDAELQEDYFVNMVPRFREQVRIEKSEKSLSRRWHIPAGVVAVLLIAALVILLNDNNTDYMEVAELSTNEIEEAASEYSLFENIDYMSQEGDDNIIEEIDSLMSTELMKFEGMEDYLTAADFSSILSGLSTEDAEIVYNEIQNKEIINGDL